MVDAIASRASRDMPFMRDQSNNGDISIPISTVLTVCDSTACRDDLTARFSFFRSNSMST
jgi:hypothetical protein